jgi:hypothetical protein
MSFPAKGLEAGSSVPSNRPRGRSWRLWSSAALLLLLIGNVSPMTSVSVMLLPSSLFALAASQATSLLECFQITTPVTIPEDADCTQTLMVHSFANSYGQPFVGRFNALHCVPFLTYCIQSDFASPGVFSGLAIRIGTHLKLNPY